MEVEDVDIHRFEDEGGITSEQDILDPVEDATITDSNPQGNVNESKL